MAEPHFRFADIYYNTWGSILFAMEERDSIRSRSRERRHVALSDLMGRTLSTSLRYFSDDDDVLLFP